ncbi:MAG: Sir2 family NAD-dependent protein deacetylase [Chloroflexi bacterium]|nr:Sir2 family NAD-dependent protein deacetylase [Chloroflexota bacterium]
MTQEGERALTNEELERASQVVAGAQYVVALVGAGLSVESGIPPFRGPGGLWTKIGEPTSRNYQRFLEDPATWWREQLKPQEGPRAEFTASFATAKPNAGHYALAELERMGTLRHVITQNVDNLHRVAGSVNLAEIHGNRTLLRCMECNRRFPRAGFPIDEMDLPPRCPRCGGVVKGDGVMFGEPIPKDVLAVCHEQAELCDCMIVIGTSATVYPAAGFAEMVYQKGGSLIEVNMYETPLTPFCQVALRGPSGEVLPRLVASVRELASQRT